MVSIFAFERAPGTPPGGFLFVILKYFCILQQCKTLEHLVNAGCKPENVFVTL